MSWPLFQGEAKLVPFHFQMNDLHQKFKLNFDIQLFRMMIFFIDRLASYNGREWNLFELNSFREALVILLNHMVSLFHVSY